MGDELKERVRELYEQSVESDAGNLALGCFLDVLNRNHDITNCRTENFQPEDSFIIKGDNADVTRYSDDYIITQSMIPIYIEITKKRKGKCCPFYEHKCIFVLEAVLRDVYGKNNRII